MKRACETCEWFLPNDPNPPTSEEIEAAWKAYCDDDFNIGIPMKRYNETIYRARGNCCVRSVPDFPIRNRHDRCGEYYPNDAGRSPPPDAKAT